VKCAFRQNSFLLSFKAHKHSASSGVVLYDPAVTPLTVDLSVDPRLRREPARPKVDEIDRVKSPAVRTRMIEVLDESDAAASPFEATNTRPRLALSTAGRWSTFVNFAPNAEPACRRRDSRRRAQNRRRRQGLLLRC
jgi:hypothetical protein